MIDYYTRTSNGDMVIRREGSGVSSFKPENLEAWRWPPRGSVAVPTRVHVDRFSTGGQMRGSWGWPTASPGEFSGRTPVGDPGYFVPQKLEQNVTLLYTFILTFSV